MDQIILLSKQSQMRKSGVLYNDLTWIMIRIELLNCYGEVLLDVKGADFI